MAKADKKPVDPIAPEVKARRTIVDAWFNSNVSDANFDYSLMTRGGAKRQKFVRVSFIGSIFEKAYFNHCEFDTCDFTGCRFDSVNFEGSQFSGCKFEYATFEKTNIDHHVLIHEFPSRDNLKLKFARTLRLNFTQVGDTDGVNLAILLELRATEAYLFDASFSKSSYYRNKYKSWRRFKKCVEWARFWTMDAVWGNGESLWKLLRAFLVLIGGVAAIDFFRESHKSLFELGESFRQAAAAVFGFLEPGTQFVALELAGITAARLALFGLFMAILIRRFSRR